MPLCHERAITVGWAINTRCGRQFGIGRWLGRSRTRTRSHLRKLLRDRFICGGQHMAASIRAGAEINPKVVQRILGHASAAMTMYRYGHLIDKICWEAGRSGREHIGAHQDRGGNGKAPSTGNEGA